jgi:hypothetical protein
VPVGQFEFLEWTADNHLRHPRFVGLREDKGRGTFGGVEVVDEKSGRAERKLAQRTKAVQRFAATGRDSTTLGGCLSEGNPRLRARIPPLKICAASRAAHLMTCPNVYQTTEERAAGRARRVGAMFARRRDHQRSVTLEPQTTGPKGFPTSMASPPGSPCRGTQLPSWPRYAQFDRSLPFTWPKTCAGRGSPR